eukprot:6206228-Pleurochrysis_carterae.AAC.1
MSVTSDELACPRGACLLCSHDSAYASVSVRRLRAHMFIGIKIVLVAEYQQPTTGTHNAHARNRRVEFIASQTCATRFSGQCRFTAARSDAQKES